MYSLISGWCRYRFHSSSLWRTLPPCTRPDHVKQQFHYSCMRDVYCRTIQSPSVALIYKPEILDVLPFSDKASTHVPLKSGQFRIAIKLNTWREFSYHTLVPSHSGVRQVIYRLLRLHTGWQQAPQASSVLTKKTANVVNRPTLHQSPLTGSYLIPCPEYERGTEPMKAICHQKEAMHQTRSIGDLNSDSVNRESQFSGNIEVPRAEPSWRSCGGRLQWRQRDLVVRDQD